jgi:heme exporter protein D
MTLETNNRVSLSVGNWIALGAVLITLLGLFSSSYLNHDRLLQVVIANQEHISKRLDKFENKLDAFPFTHPAR